MLKENKFIFIIGAPRSGTTWLHSMIASHPQVAATKNIEIKFMNHYIGPLVSAWENHKYRIDQGHWVSGLPAIWDTNRFNEFIEYFSNKVYQTILTENPNATHILDKHPGYSYCVETINRIFPKSKFIHIIRDGREVVVSMLSAKKRIGFGSDQIISASKEWKSCIEKARHAMDYGEERYLEITYELLKTNGISTLADVFKFCELAYDDNLIHNILSANDYKKNPVASPNKRIDDIRDRKDEIWRRELTLRQRFLFDKVAGRYLHDLGYENNRNWWAVHLHDKVEMFVFYNLLRIVDYLMKFVNHVRDTLLTR